MTEPATTGSTPYQPRWRTLIKTRWFTLLLATRGRLSRLACPQCLHARHGRRVCRDANCCSCRLTWRDALRGRR